MTQPFTHPDTTAMPTVAADSRTSAAAPVTLVTINRVLLAAALLVLFGYFLVYVGYALNLIAFPFDYDQGEGFELVDTLMFAQGEFPYRDTEVYPFYSSNYPPLFHVMAVPFAAAFGPAYWYGRLLGFLGTLVTAAAITYAVWRDGRNRWIALLSGLAFLASNTVYHIGPLFRQHMTMVMFETLAVVILAHANELPDQRQRRQTLAAGLLMLVAAGYTKQLAYATAAAAFLFLFIRQPRRAVVWGVGFALVFGGVFLWLNVATQGQWWLQTITANVNDYYPDQTVGLFRLWFSLHGFLIVPAALYVLYELYLDRLSIYSLWFVAATANGALSGKWGAGDSYFATSIAALCVLSGLFAARTLAGGWRFPHSYITRWLIAPLRPLARYSVPVALVVVPLVYLGYGRAVLHMPTNGVFAPVAAALNLTPNALNGFYDSAGRIAGGYADIGHWTTPDDVANGWRIVERIRAVPGPVLSEEAGFNLLAGKDVVTNPTQLLNLADNEMWRGDALIGMIERREFDLVVLRAQFYPVPVLRALGVHYERDDVIPMNGFDYLLFVPKTP